MGKINYELLAAPNDTHISLTVDNARFDNLVNLISVLPKALDYLLKQKVAAISNPVDTEDTRIDVNLSKIGRRRTGEAREKDLISLTSTLAGIGNHILLDETCPNLAVALGTNRIADGRMSMQAVVRWPAQDDDILQEQATNAMRTVADDLNYVRRKNESLLRYRSFMHEIVYAQVHRDHGVTLETNFIGSCSLGTSGVFYDSSENQFELFAHNLYGRDQQLICLAGAIALAAPELQQ